MTVAPIPVAPAAPAPNDSPAASEPPAPGFDNMLAGAQEKQAANEEPPCDPGEEQSDAPTGDPEVLALLAALAGIVPQPASATTPTPPIVTDQTAATTMTTPVAVPVEAAPGPELATDDGPTTPDPTTGPAAVNPAEPDDAPPAAVPTKPAAATTAASDRAPTVALPVAVEPVAPRPVTDPKPAPAAPSTSVNALASAAPAPPAPHVEAPAVATVAAPAPAPPAPPAEQLVTIIRPLRNAGDGNYNLRLELRPPELGRVDLRLEMRNGVLHAAISTEHAHAAAVVRDSLSDLRDRLASEGFQAGALTVDSGAAQHTPERDDRPASQSDELAPTAIVDAISADRLPATDADALLDVRI